MESTLLQTVSDFLVQWLPIITSAVGTFALVAIITPNKVDDKIGQFLMDVINFLGANFGKAKNTE